MEQNRILGMNFKRFGGAVFGVCETTKSIKFPIDWVSEGVSVSSKVILVGEGKAFFAERILVTPLFAALILRISCNSALPYECDKVRRGPNGAA